MEASAVCKNQAKRQVRNHASKPDLGPQFPGERSSADGLPSRARDWTCGAEEVEKSRQEN